jgi:gamma-glutamylputrescine oxidase
MNLSYWEYKTWLQDIDFTIVGSGIVGLSTALALRKKFPKSKIAVLERGFLPSGASTKNAGFACFGSLSEILDDFNTHSEGEVLELIKKRWKGLQLLRKTLGDTSIDYKNYGGHELFLKEEEKVYSQCLEKLPEINALLKPLFKKTVFSEMESTFGFQNIHQTSIFNTFEAQIDTGKMMLSLVKKCTSENILILNTTEVTSFSDQANVVKLLLNKHLEFDTKKLLIATNGFARQLLQEAVEPARAQVLITKKIDNLHIKGTFHLDRGYYYFRNIDNRILLGGGRNLDFKGENTTSFGTTELIQNKLEQLLQNVILPNTKVEIEHRWSGIMGVGRQKKPILKQLSENVYCGVRLGGMGIAIGSSTGNELANLL